MVFALEIDDDNWLLPVAAARVVPRTSAAAESPRNREGMYLKRKLKDRRRSQKIKTSSSSSDRWLWAIR